jgi:dipeptidyl-peptidase 4
VTDSFPRQKARTRNFTLGAPRSFKVGQDGSRVVFLRSSSGDDPRTALWVFDVAERRERLIVDPVDLAGGAGEALSAEERARRERARETAEGVVAYATDRDAQLAAFALSGRLFVADLVAGGARALDVPAPVFDPRPDPSGRLVAFVHDRGLHVAWLADGMVRCLAGEDEDTVSWGIAEFVAAEEMGRSRGYWWAPDGETLLAARVDEGPVRRLWISDAAHPDSSPRAVSYPQAGSANAAVQLHLLRLDGAPAVRVAWDAEAYPYLTDARWDDGRGPSIAVQSRDQRRLLALAVDPLTGETSSLGEQSDDAWIDLVPGVPRRLTGGRLVTVAGVEGAMALLVGGDPVTPPTMEVREVLAASGDEVLFAASTAPTEVHIHTWETEQGLRALTSAPGVHTAVAGGPVRVIGSKAMGHEGARWALGDHVFETRAERPVVEPNVRLLTVGERELRVGLVLPRDHEAGRSLPVLMAPYGGPHHQQVMADRHRWLEAQWLADQGFAVLVADGRGTPGRGSAWARTVKGDLAGPVLEDQIAALAGVAALEPDLDLGRVGIRGWSFGGYLAALAVLRRPDVFHAAVAGAPVTDWRLYDTHYTERYLGVDPEGADRSAYEGSSLFPDAATLQRPLLLIHGLIDDNVVAANTLTLSQRLTESGRLHAVLPLTGVTHMTPQEAVAENLLIVQVKFLRQALGLGTGGA